MTLIRPARAAPRGPVRTASGSLAPAGGGRARVAKASRIYVEGRHDAELAEKIWGDDLRDVGVVVEYLEGVNHLPAIIGSFSPGPQRRLGVLVDHLVPGSKESRIAAAVSGPHVLVAGHPFVDIWQAVKPAAVGITRWPTVPGAPRGRKASWPRWAGARTPPRAGSGSWPPRAAMPTWNQTSSAGWKN